MNAKMFTVDAEVHSVSGDGDAAYDLCGDFTAEELCRVLLETLQRGTVEEMLWRGKLNVGDALVLIIRDQAAGKEQHEPSEAH